MLRQYDVTFHLSRTVTISVHCHSEDDAEGDAYSELDLQDDEEVNDVEVAGGDPSGE